MERLINKLKTIFILCLVFSCVVFSIQTMCRQEK